MNIEKICRFARSIKYRRGEAIVCLRITKQEDVLLFFNFPDKVSNAPNCIATTTYNSGHAMPDSRVDIQKMHRCQHRIPDNPVAGKHKKRSRKAA